MGTDARAETLPGQRSEGGGPQGAPSAPTADGAPDARRQLVGREADLARLRRHLREHRLVTVTGSGGVGKTRLALAAVDRLEPEPSTVVVCELAEVESAAAVRHVVAARLRVHPRPGTSIGESLPAPTDDAQLLVLVDNCEHVVDAAADVAADLLAAGAHVRVLATSREPLRLAGEKVLVLHPLAVPVSVDDPSAATSPSVVLFTDRAEAVNASFTLDEQTLPDVVRVCRSLDGIPLALEIAAARVRAMGVRDIADRLGKRFRLLRSGARRIPDRHRSLRAVLDWSYELLEPAERELLTTMSVYPGGFDLDAATAAGASCGIDDSDVLDLLDGLVAKSLVTATATEGRVRYTMLETVRAYGVERLEESGRLAVARHRHADHYAATTHRIRASALRAWDEELLPLIHEFDNIRAAVTWTLTDDVAPDRAFDLIAPLCYVGIHQSAEEIAELADIALDRWPDSDHPLWSEVAATAGGTLFTLEEFARARARANAAVDANSSLVGAALAWCVLAGVSGSFDNDPATALEHLDRADAAAADAGFEPFRCDLMGVRAELLAQAGRTDDAFTAAERALAMATDQGNDYTRAWAMQLLGMLLVRSQPAAAREWLEKALTESRSAGYPFGIDAALRGLAIVSAEEGDVSAAAELFTDTLGRFVRDGFLVERWTTIAAVLPLLIRTGRCEAAATLLVGVQSSGTVISRLHAPTFDDLHDQLATELASARIAARGRAMNIDQLLALAGHELEEIRDHGRVGSSRRPRPTQSLERQAPEPAELRRVGDLWRVAFAGATVHLPDSKGLRDLAMLLSQPGREVPALDLATPPEPRRPGTAAQRAITADAGFGTPADLGDRIDAQARAAYTARIPELQAELDDADAAGDADRVARAQHELEFLSSELTAAYGMHGPRRAGDPAEKARSAVTARIRAAIAKIRDAHPVLGAHLARSIHTGRFCSYRPEDPTAWRITR